MAWMGERPLAKNLVGQQLVGCQRDLPFLYLAALVALEKLTASHRTFGAEIG